MENASRTVHGDPRPARAPREQQPSFFPSVFYESAVLILYLVPGSTYWYLLFIGTSLVFVVKAKLYTLHGKRPPENDQGRGMTAVLHLAKTVRENVAIIDIRKGDFGCIALFSLHARQS